MVAVRVQKIDEAYAYDHLDQRELEKRGELVKQLISIPLKEEDPTKIA